MGVTWISDRTRTPLALSRPENEKSETKNISQKECWFKMKFTVTEKVACQLYMAVLGLLLAEHRKTMFISLIVAGTRAGIVLPVVADNWYTELSSTWEDKPILLQHRTLKFDFFSLPEHWLSQSPNWRWWISIGSSILPARWWWQRKPWPRYRSHRGSWATGQHLPLTSNWSTYFHKLRSRKCLAEAWRFMI